MKEFHLFSLVLEIIFYSKFRQVTQLSSVSLAFCLPKLLFFDFQEYFSIHFIPLSYHSSFIKLNRVVVGGVRKTSEACLIKTRSYMSYSFGGFSFRTKLPDFLHVTGAFSRCF